MSRHHTVMEPCRWPWPLQKDDGPRAGERRADEANETADSRHCAEPGAPAQTDQLVKRFATLQARLALVGWMLTVTQTKAGQAYTASRFGRARDLADLTAVELFADLVGAPR